MSNDHSYSFGDSNDSKRMFDLPRDCKVYFDMPTRNGRVENMYISHSYVGGPSFQQDSAYKVQVRYENSEISYEESYYFLDSEEMNECIDMMRDIMKHYKIEKYYFFVTNGISEQEAREGAKRIFDTEEFTRIICSC